MILTTLNYSQFLRNEYRFFFSFVKIFLSKTPRGGGGDHYGNKVSLTIQCYPCHFKLRLFLNYSFNLLYLYYIVHFIIRFFPDL